MVEDGQNAKLYREREQRIKDAIALRVPDRVPVVYWAMFWHAAYGGHTIREVMYDYDLASKLFMKAINDLEPDGAGAAFIMNALGPLLDLTDYRQLRWPGHGVADNCCYQYIDEELMKADEYDLFIEDPTYFYLSRYLPRTSDVFAPLAKIPQFSSLQYFGLLIATESFADPEVAKGFARLAEAGAEARRMLEHAANHSEEIAAAGFPSITAGISPAPFDYFADFLRGSKGIMLDMFRKKDKLLEAMDHVVPILMRSAIEQGKNSPCNIIFMPMHWGLDGFMSPRSSRPIFGRNCAG